MHFAMQALQEYHSITSWYTAAYGANMQAVMKCADPLSRAESEALGAADSDDAVEELRSRFL